jgi:hypothetical protein
MESWGVRYLTQKLSRNEKYSQVGYEADVSPHPHLLIEAV